MLYCNAKIFTPEGYVHGGFRVEDGVFSVEADWLLPALRTVDIDDYESLQYFQRLLVSTGVIDALREAGVREGDTVSLYDFDFEFVN